MALVERLGGDEALERVQRELGDLIVDSAVNLGDVHVQVRPENLVETARRLRDGAETRCRFFSFLSGVDWSTFGDEDDEDDAKKRETPFEVLLQLHSPEFHFNVTVRVPLEGEHPVCPSVTSVFGGADWCERETHEMFGIDFRGHPHLVNLYLPEDFEGNPLRKSFHLTTRIVKQWPGAKDPDEAAAGGR